MSPFERSRLRPQSRVRRRFDLAYLLMGSTGARLQQERNRSPSVRPSSATVPSLEKLTAGGSEVIECTSNNSPQIACFVTRLPLDTSQPATLPRCRSPRRGTAAAGCLRWERYVGVPRRMRIPHSYDFPATSVPDDARSSGEDRLGLTWSTWRQPVDIPEKDQFFRNRLWVPAALGGKLV
jgi:hypothetical protein